ncbi:MAG TPA: S53 family peptidase [Acidobacteriaceae bacterium]|jgi:subtilase family serine protease
MNLLSVLGKGRVVFGCALALTVTLAAAGADQGSSRQPSITKKIDETRLTRLVGNVRPEATSSNDRGAVGDSMELQHVQLLLQRPADSEAALSAYMERLQTPGNPDYHNWLTAEQLGAQYGPSSADIATVRAWLEMHGFQVNGISPSGMRIDFSGTAGQIIDAFKTEIHNLQVNGEKHFANMQEPAIPEALAPVVAGIASLNDFKPHPARTPITPMTAKGATRSAVSPNYTVNADYQLLVPADLETIYDFNPVYKSGTAGQGQTVILLERTDLYSNADYTTFRKTFGLDAYKNSKFSVVHPGGCTDPGVLVGDDGEAAVDVEWAAAAAPGADIELASCADSATNFGAFIALQSLIDQHHRPAIVSLSYDGAESEQGASGNLYIYQLYQQAAAEGVSVFVASGDSGAAVDSQNQEFAANGITVNGLASTPFNLAAGGTDYADAYLGTTGNYWNSTNSAVYGSAKSYIPEIPWNDSCASQLITTVLGYTVPYGVNGTCNSPLGEEFLGTAAGSGGPSACAYGTPANNEIATSGSCRGYQKPSWQNIYGNPNDGVRDLPDVSLFAANGVWGHYYVICYTDAAGGGAPCTGAPSNWAGAGGTSFVAPILAGVQALINQNWGHFQGNPNYAYYALGNLEYGWWGNASCNSTNGSGKSCVFHDVTLGDNDVNCRGNVNCYLPSGTNGVLSVSSKKYEPAYGATPGWDFATGIGTLDVNQVVRSWVWFK